MTAELAWTLGSDPESDVWIRNGGDPDVEGKHCRFQCTADQFVVSDLQTEFGTWVDGDRIRGDVIVEPDSVIKLSKQITLPWPACRGARQVITFGRGDHNAVVLRRDGVSGTHGRLVIGQHGSIVVEDLDSTNGIAIKSGDTLQRIRRSAAVTPQDVLFLGASHVSVESILAAADARGGAETSGGKGSPSPLPAGSAVESPTLRKSTPDRGVAGIPLASSAIAASVIGVAVLSLVSLLGLWAFLGGSDSVAKKQETVQPLPVDEQPGGDLGQPDVEHPKPNPSPEKETQTDAAAGSGLPSEPDLSTPETTTVDLSEPPPTPEPVRSNKPVDPSDALFWVVVESEADGSLFRVGTAWAHSDSTLLTTAAVAAATEQLVADGHDRAMAVRPSHDQTFPIAKTDHCPQYPQHAQATGDAITRFQTRIRSLREQAEGDSDTRSRPDNALSQQALGGKRDELLGLVDQILSLQGELAAADLGLLTLQSELPASIPRLPLYAARPVRRNQQLSLLSIPFQTDDPYFDPAFPRDQQSRPIRVQDVMRTKNERIQVVFSGHNTTANENLFGSPLVDAAGRVVGAFSMTSTDKLLDAMINGQPSPGEALALGPAAANWKELIETD